MSAMVTTQDSGQQWPYGWRNKGIVPDVKLVPEVQPRDTNYKKVLFPIEMLPWGLQKYMCEICSYSQ